MTSEQTLWIERECARLVAQYCHYIDHGAAAKVAELFASDGTWTAPGVSMNGQGELRAGFKTRQDNAARMSRHVCNNLLIDVVDENNATGSVYLTLYTFDGEEGRTVSPLEGPNLVGEYNDVFVRTEEGWRFQSRATTFEFFRSMPEMN